MRIADVDAEDRGALARRLFAPGSGSVAAALDRRFETRYWRFAGTVGPLQSDAGLSFNGSRSDIVSALGDLAGGDRSRRLAAIVLVTDGGSRSTEALDDVLRGLKADKVAVHTVGIGTERFAKDLEVTHVQVADRVLRDDSIEAEVTINHRGLGGQSASLIVEQDSVIIEQTAVDLPADRDRVTVRVPLQLPDAGPRRIGFRLAAAPDEIVTDNNVLYRTVHVRDDVLKVLHFEGETAFRGQVFAPCRRR